jgi:hypothetical protein
MNRKEGKVVVHCSMEYFTRGDGQMIAARIRQLGLTGYGRTVEQAKEAVEELFVSMAESHRDEGLLAKHLDDLEVRWMWHQECSQAELEGVTDLSPKQEAKSPVSSASASAVFRLPMELAA